MHMPKYKVTFEATGVTNSRAVSACELGPADLEKATAQFLKEATAPQWVMGVVDAHVSEDDAQGQADIKCFACVSLVVSGDSRADIERRAPPVALLDRVVGEMLTACGELDLNLEDNWAQMDIEEIHQVELASTH
jgi:hypothetical protein